MSGMDTDRCREYVVLAQTCSYLKRHTSSRTCFATGTTLTAEGPACAQPEGETIDLDTPENFDQSCRLYERLRQAGQDVTFYKLPDADHGSNGFRCQEALDVIEGFLRRHLL